MNWWNSRRAARAEDVRNWIAEHRDPRDPLTRPVELMLDMHLALTSWRAHVLPVFAATLLGAGVTAGVARLTRAVAPATVEVRADEQVAMREWVESGEASRVMRCDSEGLTFTEGRCRTIAAGGWLIPLPAQQRLTLERSAATEVEKTVAHTSIAHKSGRGGGSVVSPWTQ